MSDAKILRVLELKDSGLSSSKIARRVKVSRNAVVGILYRVNRDADAAGSILDGTMPYGWWNEGLRKQDG